MGCLSLLDEAAGMWNLLGMRGADLLLMQLRAELAQRDATIAQRDATIALLQAELEQREQQLAEAQARVVSPCCRLCPCQRASCAELTFWLPAPTFVRRSNGPSHQSGGTSGNENPEEPSHYGTLSRLPSPRSGPSAALKIAYQIAAFATHWQKKT